jgi:hypothetical protein
MIIRPSRRLRFWLPVVVSIVAALAALAQDDELEPRWLRLEIPETSVGMEVEGLTESQNGGGLNSTHNQLSLVPDVGLQTRGSIYHPDLISFDLNGEFGWGWLSDSVNSSGSVTTRNENDTLLRYLAQINLLPAKPYNATFSAAQDHTYRTYDAFDSYTVDSTRYSGRFGWVTPALELNADMGYRDDNSSGLNGSSDVVENYLNLYGTQKRQNAQSTLTYRYDQFDNTINSSNRQTSVFNSVGLSDSETFGSRQQINASTSAGYSEAQYSSQQTETITANENVTVKNGPKLDSYLMFNFSDSRMSPADASVLQGTLGVRHQLYDSLTTTFDVHGNYDNSSSSSSSATDDRYGVGLREDYNKRLGDWGHLSLGGSIVADHEDHYSSGGVLTVVDEQHYLTNSPAFLNNPKVITSTIQVRSYTDGTIYVEGADYTIVQAGELTGIAAVPGSVNVNLHGSEVLVNYQSDSLYNASFETFNSGAQIRLDLFNQFGIYGRLNWVDNNAPPQALAETLTDLTGGMDYTWRWIHASAEYEDYNSNFSQYKAWRFLQSFNYQLSSASRCGLDFSQNFYRYSDNLNQDQYQFIARYNTQFDFPLAWFVEGGYDIYNMSATDQNSAFARTGLTWSRGKLNVRAGYEYNYQTSTTQATTPTTAPTTQQNERNYFFVYLKRSF